MRYSVLHALAVISGVVAEVHNIAVGRANGNPIFEPAMLNATRGTSSSSSSSAPGNHTVTQSSFAKPCEPAPGGFDSGWVQLGSGAKRPSPTFNITITNSIEPIFFYCKQLSNPSGKPHCELAMVGGINVGPEESASFAFKAQDATIVGQAQGGLPSTAFNAIATAYPVAMGSDQSVIIGPSDAPAATGAPTGKGSRDYVCVSGLFAGFVAVLAAAMML
ncbi:hypothetical protein MKEN_01322200 [Mycena kentingensis (nom. inval.)]|nr:hypothetical protein MKEN_01322200 [Mycena kentingensis (nom. inval.)]